MYVKYLNIHKCSENDTPIKKLYILNSFKKCFSQIEGKIPYPPLPPTHTHKMIKPTTQSSILFKHRDQSVRRFTTCAYTISMHCTADP